MMPRTKEELAEAWKRAKTQRELAEIEHELFWIFKSGSKAVAIHELIPEAGTGVIGSRARLTKLSERMPDLIKDVWYCIDEIDAFGVHTATRLISQARDIHKKERVEWADAARKLIGDFLAKHGHLDVPGFHNRSSSTPSPTDPNELWARVRALAASAPVVYGVSVETDAKLARAMQRFRTDLDVAIRDLQKVLLLAQRQLTDSVPPIPDAMPTRWDVVKACQQLNAEPPTEGQPFTHVEWSKVKSQKRAMDRAYHPDSNFPDSKKVKKHAIEFFQAAQQAYQLLQKYQDEMSKPKEDPKQKPNL